MMLVDKRTQANEPSLAGWGTVPRIPTKPIWPRMTPNLKYMRILRMLRQTGMKTPLTVPSWW